MSDDCPDCRIYVAKIEMLEFAIAAYAAELKTSPDRRVRQVAPKLEELLRMSEGLRSADVRIEFPSADEKY